MNSKTVVDSEPRKRETQDGANDSTRDKILDAAEKLFGERTFDTVSLREITQEANVTLALASYHFRTKERLHAQVVERRAAILAQIRRERLELLRRKQNLTTESIFDAFMRPLFEKITSEDEGWEPYVLILVQLGQSNRWLELLHKNFDETAELFLAELRKTLPTLKKSVLLRVFGIALGAMLHTVSRNRRINALSGGSVKAEDLDAAYKVLLKFVVGGIEGLATK